jgi:hypothetical protein
MLRKMMVISMIEQWQKDFQENHSPVVNDATFCTILILYILLKLQAGHFDIETAFLYGDLEESLWMELPLKT